MPVMPAPSGAPRAIAATPASEIRELAATRPTGARQHPGHRRGPGHDVRLLADQEAERRRVEPERGLRCRRPADGAGHHPRQERPDHHRRGHRVPAPAAATRSSSGPITGASSTNGTIVTSSDVATRPRACRGRHGEEDRAGERGDDQGVGERGDQVQLDHPGQARLPGAPRVGQRPRTPRMRPGRPARARAGRRHAARRAGRRPRGAGRSPAPAGPRPPAAAAEAAAARGRAASGAAAAARCRVARLGGRAEARGAAPAGAGARGRWELVVHLHLSRWRRVASGRNGRVTAAKLRDGGRTRRVPTSQRARTRSPSAQRPRSTPAVRRLRTPRRSSGRRRRPGRRSRTPCAPPRSTPARAAAEGMPSPAPSASTSVSTPRASGLVTHSFACLAKGYRGWRWAVTVARAPRSRTATVCETVLLPGGDAILAAGVAALVGPARARRPRPRRRAALPRRRPLPRARLRADRRRGGRPARALGAGPRPGPGARPEGRAAAAEPLVPRRPRAHRRGGRARRRAVLDLRLLPAAGRGAAPGVRRLRQRVVAVRRPRRQRRPRLRRAQRDRRRARRAAAAARADPRRDRRRGRRDPARDRRAETAVSASRRAAVDGGGEPVSERRSSRAVAGEAEAEPGSDRRPVRHVDGARAGARGLGGGAGPVPGGRERRGGPRARRLPRPAGRRARAERRRRRGAGRRPGPAAAAAWTRSTAGRCSSRRTPAPRSTPAGVAGAGDAAGLRQARRRPWAGARRVGRFGVGFAAVLGVTDEPAVLSRHGGVRFSAADTRDLLSELSRARARGWPRSWPAATATCPCCGCRSPPRAPPPTATTPPSLLPLRDAAAEDLVLRLLAEVGRRPAARPARAARGDGERARRSSR